MRALGSQALLVLAQKLEAQLVEPGAVLLVQPGRPEGRVVILFEGHAAPRLDPKLVEQPDQLFGSRIRHRTQPIGWPQAGRLEATARPHEASGRLVVAKPVEGDAEDVLGL